MSPRMIAGSLNCSSSYLAKTTNLLVKAGVLKSIRGVNGGVLLARSPDRISLLDIVEACQGLLTADFCEGPAVGPGTCSFHCAMNELHAGTLAVLSGWTLDRILEQPVCAADTPDRDRCRMYFSACDRLLSDRSAAAGGKQRRRRGEKA